MSGPGEGQSSSHLCGLVSRALPGVFGKHPSHVTGRSAPLRVGRRVPASCVGGLGAGGSPCGCFPGRAAPLVASAPAPGEPGALPSRPPSRRCHHASPTVFSGFQLLGAASRDRLPAVLAAELAGGVPPPLSPGRFRELKAAFAGGGRETPLPGLFLQAAPPHPCFLFCGLGPAPAPRQQEP